MRAVLALLLLAGCTAGAAPRVVTQTPASISYECIAAFGGCSRSPQQIADAAQQHCSGFGKNARQVEMGVAPSGNLRASFICV